MKQVVKRIAGVAAVAVGATGAILSALAVLQVWTAATHLHREIPVAVGRLEMLVESAQQQAEATVMLLETARDRVDSINAAVEDLADQAEQRSPTSSLLETLEGDIGQRLERAEDFVLSMQASLRGMSNALLLVDSVPFLSPRLTLPDGQADSHLRVVAKNLIETADLLEQVIGNLSRIRSEQVAITPRQLAQVRDTLDRVHRQLHDIQAEVRAFTQTIDRTGVRLAALRQDVPQRINQTAGLATILLVCFGFSQLSLLLHGCQLLKAK